MESTIRVEQKLSQSIKTVKSHYERLVIKIHKVYCCSVDSHIFIQTSVSSSSIFQSEKLIKATLWQAVDIYHLSHAWTSSASMETSSSWLWKAKRVAGVKIFITHLQDISLRCLFFCHINIFSRFSDHHRLDFLLLLLLMLYIQGGDTRYLQISGLQSNTFLTDLMTMVEGEEVRNDILMMMI